MSGCENCGGKTGCDHRKGNMMAEVEEALARLYPRKTWGDIDDTMRTGLDESESRAVAQTLSAQLKAATFYKPGNEHEFCDYVYVLCQGRQPSILEIREQEWGYEGPPLRDLYLRISLSQLAPMAAVQEVVMELDIQKDALLIRELPRAGVYDAPLLPRFQKLVAILVDHHITHVDFGEICTPPAGFSAGDYPNIYGSQADIVNYLFYPQPCHTQVLSNVTAHPTHVM